MNFYEFDIPVDINGEQLKKELGCDEVYIRDNKLIIGGDLTESEAAAGLVAHIPTPIAQLTVQEKLAAAGLSIDELKEALGL